MARRKEVRHSTAFMVLAVAASSALTSILCGSVPFLGASSWQAPSACTPCVTSSAQRQFLWTTDEVLQAVYGAPLPPCPSNCNAAHGWGRCERSSGQCICVPGHGGPDCTFSLQRLFGGNGTTPTIYQSLKSSPQFFKPLDLQGWAQAPPEFFFDYLSLAEAVTVIEVGVWKGQSASMLARWLKDKGRGVLIAVDAWLGSAERWYWSPGAVEANVLQRQFGYPTVYHQFLSNVIHQGLEDVVVPLPSPTKVATIILKNFNVTADLIHIDASHDYGSCLEDIQLWWPFLRFGGILMGDDWSTHWPGVQRAVQEFVDSCELQLVTEGVKWVVHKPPREVYRLKRHLPAFCHQGATDHLIGMERW